MTVAARSREFSRTMRLASLALSYPDDQWWRDIPLMDTAADSLSGAPRAAMRRYLGAMAGTGHGAAQRAYVDTFDLRRRCCLYLTYYSCGDTRKRGMSLLQFTAAGRGSRARAVRPAGVHGRPPVSALGILLWIIVPYVAIATFALGHIWRYRYDKFGWTTRSSQLYESRLLRLGSPLFHFGILLVIGGHVFGILVPEAATGAVGISEHAYHLIAVALGSVSGFMTVAGMAILIYRRRVTGQVFSATTRNDKAMYVLLAGAIVAGLSTTVLGNLLGHPYDYRLTIAPYFRSIFYAHPDVSLINAAPIGFQIHVMLAWVLFAAWPFTRLVHVFSAPVGYLTRPYIVYRSRGGPDAVRPARRGWEPVRRPGR